MIPFYVSDALHFSFVCRDTVPFYCEIYHLTLSNFAYMSSFELDIRLRYASYLTDFCKMTCSICTHLMEIIYPLPQDIFVTNLVLLTWCRKSGHAIHAFIFSWS